MQNGINQMLIDISNIDDTIKLVQIIELAESRLGLKTVSAYAKSNKMSYNGVKNNRPTITLGGVKFVCDGLNVSNLPF